MADADTTLTLEGPFITVRAAISASPGAEFTVTVPAGQFAGQTITIVESDSNDGDAYIYNVVPATGNLYGPDGSTVGTTTVTNETIQLQWLPISGAAFGWHIISQHQ